MIYCCVCVYCEILEFIVDVVIDFDGVGEFIIFIGVGFYDYMLMVLLKYLGIDMMIIIFGDVEIDGYYSIEDMVIVLGQVFVQVLGDKCGIMCFGDVVVFFDEVFV